MANQDSVSVPNEHGPEPVDRPVQRMGPMVLLTPQRTPHGGETLSAAQMQISPEAAIDIPQRPGHLPQQGLPQAENRGRVSSPQGSGRKSRHSRSRGPESRSRPVGEESLAVRRRVFDSGVGSRPVPNRPLPLPDQPAQPTGVMSVGRAMWPAGLKRCCSVTVLDDGRDVCGEQQRDSVCV